MEDFLIDPMMEYPNYIIIYHKTLNGIPIMSVQIDTKNKTMLEFLIKNETTDLINDLRRK